VKGRHAVLDQQIAAGGVRDYLREEDTIGTLRISDPQSATTQFLGSQRPNTARPVSNQRPLPCEAAHGL
jgi:hypothetical protein